MLALVRSVAIFGFFAIWGASAQPTPVQKLEAYYSGMLNESCALVRSSAPALPNGTANAFLAAYRAFNGSNSEASVLQLAAVLLGDGGVRAFLSKPWSGDSLDVAMVECAVLVESTPLGLAEFAVQGEEEKGAVDALLRDPLLMRTMLVAGGAASGPRGNRDPPKQFGRANFLLQQIYNASSVLPHIPTAPPGGAWDDRNQSTMLHRLALGTALAHAVPIALRYPDPSLPNSTYLDPIARYLHYESWYRSGDLDPAMEVLTAFELRWAANSDASNADLQWLRLTMATFRPEILPMSYDWRFAEAVHTDVAYGDPQCAQLPGICNGHYWQIPAAGGECGPRAFFGRYTKKAFGIPTWGVTQPGHAAMSTWTPEGWKVLLGASWDFSWWGPRSGDDFFLETQCRELRPQYQQVLRGLWLADALGETPVNQAWTPRSPSSYGQGGVWSALMLYAQKLAVNATTPPPRPIGPSKVPTKIDAFIAKWQQPLAKENISTNAAGTITIPASAFTSKNRSAPVSAMWSFDEGEQVLHSAGNYADPSATSFSYTLDMPHAATMYLTANHTTWHMNTDLLLQTNTTKSPLNVPVYYTVGWWNQTQSVAVQLLQGTNVLTFSRSTPAAIAIKEFFLYTTKPNIPPPPKNHSTKPIPKPSDYIEVSALTSCVKQGITDVPEQLCQDACEAVGLKYTGAKPRTNMTDCYGLTDGEWKGDCNYNSNASATICSDPPCKVFGSTAQQICLRN